MKLWWLAIPAVLIGTYMIKDQISGRSPLNKVDAIGQCRAALDAPENKPPVGQEKDQSLVIHIDKHEYRCSRQADGSAAAKLVEK